MITEQSGAIEILAAIEKEDIGLTSRLLAQGIRPNTASQNGWTPLMLAILHNSFDLIKLLLENGADPNLTTQSEENPCRSPLMVAVSNGRMEAVKLLLAYNVNADIPDYRGRTAINLAQKLSLRPLHKSQMISIVSLLQEYHNSPVRYAASDWP